MQPELQNQPGRYPHADDECPATTATCHTPEVCEVIGCVRDDLPDARRTPDPAGASNRSATAGVPICPIDGFPCGDADEHCEEHGLHHRSATAGGGR